MFTSIFKALTVASILAVAGCTTPAVHVTNQVFNFGQPLPSDMLERHVAGWVGFDEDWVGAYNLRSRTAIYSQGVAAVTPEYQYRVALINLSNTTSDTLWKKQGELTFATGAMVPDHLPRLMAGDIVEIRNTSTWHAMKNFSEKGEGNVVVRVLCKKSSPDYDQCLDAQPRVGAFKGKGETHTAYPHSAQEYGYTFTPFYSATGTPLKSFPTDNKRP